MYKCHLIMICCCKTTEGKKIYKCGIWCGWNYKRWIHKIGGDPSVSSWLRREPTVLTFWVIQLKYLILFSCVRTLCEIPAPVRSKFSLTASQVRNGMTDCRAQASFPVSLPPFQGTAAPRRSLQEPQSRWEKGLSLLNEGISTLSFPCSGYSVCLRVY